MSAARSAPPPERAEDRAGRGPPTPPTPTAGVVTAEQGRLAPRQERLGRPARVGIREDMSNDGVER